MCRVQSAHPDLPDVLPADFSAPLFLCANDGYANAMLAACRANRWDVTHALIGMCERAENHGGLLSDASGCDDLIREAVCKSHVGRVEHVDGWVRVLDFIMSCAAHEGRDDVLATIWAARHSADMRSADALPRAVASGHVQTERRMIHFNNGSSLCILLRLCYAFGSHHVAEEILHHKRHCILVHAAHIGDCAIVRCVLHFCEHIKRLPSKSLLEALLGDAVTRGDTAIAHLLQRALEGTLLFVAQL